MKHGYNYVLLQLFCFFLNNGHLKFSRARMYNTDEFYKRLVLRQVPDNNECDEDKLLNYLGELQAVNPENIINWATVKDLKTFCNDLDVKVKNMNEYLGTCTLPSQKNLYYDLMHGVEAFDNKLCKDKHFLENFMKNAECFQSLSEEYKLCAGPGKWIDNPNKEEKCKAYKKTADCYYVKTELVCGPESAKKFKKLLVSVIDSILKVKCEEVSKTPPTQDVLMEKQPELSGKSTTFSLTPLFVVISIVCFAIVVYTTSKCMKKKNDKDNGEKQKLRMKTKL